MQELIEDTQDKLLETTENTLEAIQKKYELFVDRALDK
jgi:hypothetical protein